MNTVKDFNQSSQLTQSITNVIHILNVKAQADKRGIRSKIINNNYRKLFPRHLATSL